MYTKYISLYTFGQEIYTNFKYFILILYLKIEVQETSLGLELIILNKYGYLLKPY